MLYVVRSSGLLDAQIDAGLSLVEIRSSLASVTVSQSSVTYDTLVYADDTALLLNYNFRFTLNMEAEISTEDFGAIRTVLLEVWTAQKTGNRCEETRDVSFIITSKKTLLYRVFDWFYC